MQSVIPTYKPLGLTPYQAILEFKKRFAEYENKKISYAGRLDPMAEGLLLLLVDDENKKRKEYEKLQKTYEFTVLLGVETDTYDILGKTSVLSPRAKRGDLMRLLLPSMARDRNDRVKIILQSFIGKHFQQYPAYSSKAVQGKPLYWWARQNRLHDIEIPKKEIEIYDLKLISSANIEIQDLRFNIQEGIKKVQGDFRQEEILKGWASFFETNTLTSLPVLNCQITCSSGTYVRGLAHEIGGKLGYGAIALSIKRTSIGEFNISSIIKL